MLGVKTEGIILKRRNFGEADRILTVFSPKLGKISIMAKGVRRITSRRGGNVELLNRVSMYLHQSKNFLILTEAQAIETHEKIKQDLTLSTYAYHLIELVDKFTAENQENFLVYEDLIQVLQYLSKNPRQILIRAFEAKILSKLGFVSFNQHDLLKQLENSSWLEISQIEISKEQALELDLTLQFQLEKVLESKLKSRQFLKKS